MERTIILIALIFASLSFVTSTNPLPPSSNETRATFLTEQVPTQLNNSDERSTTIGAESEDQLKVSTAKLPNLESTTIVNMKSQPSNANVVIEPSEEINSFGIRSFTAEVSPKESPPTTTTTPKATEQAIRETSLAPETGTQIPTTVKTVQKQTAKALSEDKREKNAKINTPSDEAENENEMEKVTEAEESERRLPSRVHIERKLDNGLYRIKIGEITTDEFSNLLNFDELEDEAFKPDASLHHEQPKVNINDFFASKDEDFSRSPVKKVKETGEVTSASIEIELVEETTKNPEVKSTPVVPETAETEFIPRRSKKSDIPSTDAKTNKKDNEKIHDFAMTKFTSEGSNGTQQQTVNGNPAFSTTKFYNNNKELYNEILHKVGKPAAAIVAIKTSPKAPQEKLSKTNKVATEAPKIPSLASETKTTKQRPLQPTSYPRIVTRLEDKLNALDCEVQNLSTDSTIWRGNETHQIFLPATVSKLRNFKPLRCSCWNTQNDYEVG